MLEAEKHADDVDVDDAAERGERVLGDRLHLTLYPGIVVEDVDGPEGVDRGADIGCDLVLVGHIGRDGEGLRGGRQVRDRASEIRFPAVDGDDPRPALGQQADGRGSDDARSAGDDGDLAVQSDTIGHLVSLTFP